MTDSRDEQIERLRERVDALEAILGAAPPTPPGHRRLRNVTRVCAVLLVACAGWAIAQTPAPPGQPPPAGTGDGAAVQPGPDGTTRVRAPFAVVDASGKVLLSVAAERDDSAATSAYVMNGAGMVTTNSGSGNVMAAMGMNTNGYGTFMAYDSAAKARAFVHGNGSFQAQNEAGKQVALLASLNGTGVVGVWGADAQRIAALTEGPTGGGELTIFDKGRRSTLATLGADAAGGVLRLFGPGKTVAGVDLGITDTGAGDVVVAERGGQKAAILSGDSGDGTSVLVLLKDGRAISSLGINKVGAGDLVLANASGGFGLEATGAPESAPGRGGAVGVYNQDGVQVAGMGTKDDGSGQVTVQETGRLLASLERADDGKSGQLTVHNPNGAPSVQTSGGAEGGGVIVFNKQGNPVATVETSPIGNGSITIFKTDKAVAELTADADGAGKLDLKNAAGRTGVAASGESGGGGSVLVYGQSGDPVAGLGVENNKGYVSIYDQDRNVAGLRAEQGGTGYLYLTDARGRVSVSADGETGSVNAFHQDRLAATLGAFEGRGRVAAFGKAGPLAELAEGASGGGVVFVRNSKNTAVAGISGSHNDGGAVVVRTGAGATLAQMGTTADGRGEIKVMDEAGTALAVIGESPDTTGGAIEVFSGKLAVVNIKASSKDGGYLQLLEPGGRPIIEAGVGDGVGVVRAGPNFKCGSNYLGLKIPDCIVGLQ